MLLVEPVRLGSLVRTFALPILGVVGVVRWRTVESSDLARAWTTELVAEILRPLQQRTEDRLYAIPWIAQFPVPELAAAALIIRWATRYANGEPPDSLIAALGQSAEDPDRPMPAEDARELTLIARLMVHSGALPDPRWWEPTYHSEHLAIACAREAAAGGRDPSDVVRRRLGFSTARVKEILEKASHEPGVRFNVDRDASGELGDRLAGYLHNGVAEEILERTLTAIPEAADARPDLAFCAAQTAQLRAAAEGALRDGDEDLLGFIEREAVRLGEACAGLSLLERELMRQVDGDEQLLIEVAAIAKRTLTLSKEMVPTELTDLIDGRREIPRGLETYLGLAGQSYQQRIGPIISWSVTFEVLLPDGFDRDGAATIGIALVDETDAEFIVRTTYNGEAMDARLYYPPESPEATMALAVLALNRCVRIDFFIVTNTRSISHVRQTTVLLADNQHAEVVSCAVARCRDLMSGGKKSAMKEIEREHSEQDAPVIAFLMNEAGKSEQLLDARSPGAALGPTHQATPVQEAQLANVRRSLLIAEAERIENPSETNRNAASTEAASYIALIQRSRGQDPRTRARRSIDDVEEVISGVASQTRAVVHLTIDSRGLELAWADQAEGRTEVDLLSCEDVDLDQLEKALSSPEGGSVVALDRPDGPGVALGSRIREQMAARGVDQLLVCSTRHLHQLPVHALRVDSEGDQRLLDVAEVIYAPSAAIVARLVDVPPRVGPKLVVAAGGDLVHAADEAALVARLTNAEEILVGAASKPAAVLALLARASWVHIASHGTYCPRDYLASSLLLPTDDDQRAHLNVARILAEAELSGIELAVLGACQSGAGQTETATLDIAGGIDTAFLAAGVRNVVSALWEIDDLGALLFHGELYRRLSAGQTLMEAYRAAVDLLRSGSWMRVRELPLGTLLADIGVDIEAILAELRPGDDGDVPLDLANLKEWAPYRICGLGTLQR
jgi:CHAT domain-containing protein